MKRFGLNTGLVFASWALVLMFGCHKKKPNIPPEETPPTIISQLPTEPTEPPAQQNPPPTEQPQAVNNKPPEKPAHPPSRHPKTHATAPKKPATEPEKPATTEEAKNIPPTPPTPPAPRVVIQENGANSGTGQVATDSSKENSSSTQQLLQTAESNLRNLKPQLSEEEKSLLTQINDYIKQSKDATKDGDNVRAHNLALKARILSDELVKK